MAAARVNRSWAPPRTAWGHPDLEGIWTTDDMRGIPQSAPRAIRHSAVSDRSGIRGARSAARTRAADAGPRRGRHVPQRGGHALLQLHVDGDRPAGRPRPADGSASRAAALDARHVRRRAVQQRARLQPLRSLHHARRDRLVRAGRVRQRRTNIADAGCGDHLLRDGPRHARSSRSTAARRSARTSASTWATRAGIGKGTRSSSTTSNFTDKTNIAGARHSEQLRLTERFTRIDPEMIDYEIRVDDPLTWEQPWTMRMTITQQPNYEIYEYSCHEGNVASQAHADGRARLREGGRRGRGEGVAAAGARVRARERTGPGKIGSAPIARSPSRVGRTRFWVAHHSQPGRRGTKLSPIPAR